jgi:DNA-binding LacI/PurR family transcriptional regulator
MSAVPDVRKASATAVVASNDLLAIGLLRGLAAVGVRVPRDVSVVGFDDIFASDFGTPALTTVAAPLRALGASAVQHLLALIGGAVPRTGGPIVLPVRLVVRGSTGRRSTRRPASGRGTPAGSAPSAPRSPAVPAPG